jgi:hypothetical protein
MAVEGVGVFILAKHMSPGPSHAEAAAIGGLGAHGGEKAPLDAELEVGKLRAQNEKSQQLVVYDMTIAMTVADVRLVDQENVGNHSRGDGELEARAIHGLEISEDVQKWLDDIKANKAARGLDAPAG